MLHIAVNSFGLYNNLYPSVAEVKLGVQSDESHPHYREAYPQRDYGPYLVLNFKSGKRSRAGIL